MFFFEIILYINYMYKSILNTDIIMSNVLNKTKQDRDLSITKQSESANLRRN